MVDRGEIAHMPGVVEKTATTMILRITAKEGGCLGKAGDTSCKTRILSCNNMGEIARKRLGVSQRPEYHEDQHRGEISRVVRSSVMRKGYKVGAKKAFETS